MRASRTVPASFHARSFRTYLAVIVLGSAEACGPAKPAENASHGDEASSSSSSGVSADGPTASGSGDGTAASTPTGSQAPLPSPPAADGVPYEKDAVEMGLKRAARQVRANCGAATNEDGKALGPWGKTTVTVKIGHNGHSQGATILPPYDDKPAGKCAVQAFAILTFPPFAGADATVDWPVEIVAPAAH